ncbi:MAG TPA: pyrimidine 5'-nucleotidase [Anaerolineae bacterium]|nr:pyrimidine 5'-nucleotidase [Anaerolineae bacterium]
MLEFIIFDLDETLYPRADGLMIEVGRRIQDWLQRRFSLTPEEAVAMRRYHYTHYGTTLSGLIVEHHLAPAEVHDYLRFVHDVRVTEYVSPNPALAAMLDSIPLRKAVYTNATVEYARRVLRALGVADRFERLIGIEEVGLLSKVYREAYERALERLGAPGRACVMVEDTPVNLRSAKSVGMTTVLVGKEPVPEADFVVARVLDVADVVRPLIRKRAD